MLYDFRSFINPGYYAFGKGSFNHLNELIERRKENSQSWSVFMVDDYFKGKELESKLPKNSSDLLIWIDTTNEPKTSLVNRYRDEIIGFNSILPSAIIGIGGGTTMDYAKATGLMVTNPGDSADYQGLDLINKQGIYTICVPTISGTGAEVSMTAVLSGPEKKLGIKCDYTMPDEIVFDPELLATVPPDQRFYTGMDCYIHNEESLNGTWINSLGRAFAEKSSELCVEVFSDTGASRIDNDEKMMVASLLGGNSVTFAQVGVCHALSYGLSHVLGVHHGVGNCVVFNQLEEYYPEGFKQFKVMQETQQVEIPTGVVANSTVEQLDQMVETSWALEHMWNNAFGIDWKNHITKEKIRELFLKM